MEKQINNLPKGWYSRGYLPHFDGGETTQFITYRLADSLPQNVLKKWQNELGNNQINDAEFRKNIEVYLDKGYGECYLNQQDIAEMIEENLLRFDKHKYKLYAWVIMPNHIHLLLTPKIGYSLSKVVHSCKSYSASMANKILERSGKFWFPESFDRFIRNYEHFENTFTYIEQNPVKAKLCEKSSDWRFSSAYRRKKEEL
jgi:REP element-mobilizing transposase RayT